MIIKGVVAGRNHGVIRDAKARPEIERACRRWIPFDNWESDLLQKWRSEGVGDEKIAIRLMRPVSQITRFNPVRPNRRIGW